MAFDAEKAPFDSQKAVFTGFDAAAALECAERWHGTPHRDRMAKVGVGIDCIHFVREVMIAGGISEPFDCPYYLPRWGVGRDNNVMERLLLRCFEAELVPYHMEPVQDGDVLIFQVGRQSNHCGIVIGGQCWHSQAKYVVHPIPMTPELLCRLQAVVRLTACGPRFRPEELTQEDFKQ